VRAVVALLRPICAVSLFALATAVFNGNILGTAPAAAFNTARDGSESLVVAKIFADAHGIETRGGHLGYVRNDEDVFGPNILAVYRYLEAPDALIPFDINDANWRHGIGRSISAILLERAASAKVGYATDEARAGTRLRFADGQVRTVSELSVSDRYVSLHLDGSPLDGDRVGFPHRAEFVYPPGESPSREKKFSPYASQFGIQGVAFSALYRHLPGLASLERLHLAAAAALALTVLLLAREYAISISPGMAIAFLACMIGSPWVVAVARNLYWVPFLWFLPALVAMGVYRARTPRSRAILLALFFGAVLVKSLAGYEYLSSVVALAGAVYLADALGRAPRESRPHAWRMVVLLLAISILAFLCALLMHAANRGGGDVLAGLHATWITDALRYTVFEKDVWFAGRPVPESPLAWVIARYTWGWDSALLFGISARILFPLLLAGSVLALGLRKLSGHPVAAETSLLVAFAAAPVSWLVLVPMHSVFHVHLNYVLWYFGFMPILLWVNAKGAVWLLGTAVARLAGRAGSEPRLPR